MSTRSSGFEVLALDTMIPPSYNVHTIGSSHWFHAHLAFERRNTRSKRWQLDLFASEFDYAAQSRILESLCCKPDWVLCGLAHRIPHI
jgi:hypothetical protein